jgi:hypothetical protein
MILTKVNCLLITLIRTNNGEVLNPLKEFVKV